MAIRQICDVCNADITVPGDTCSAPRLALSHHGGLNSIDCCLGCLKSIVRTLCERYPNAPSTLGAWARDALRDLRESERREEKWRGEDQNTEEK